MSFDLSRLTLVIPYESKNVSYDFYISLSQWHSKLFMEIVFLEKFKIFENFLKIQISIYKLKEALLHKSWPAFSLIILLRGLKLNWLNSALLPPHFKMDRNEPLSQPLRKWLSQKG